MTGSQSLGACIVLVAVFLVGRASAAQPTKVPEGVRSALDLAPVAIFVVSNAGVIEYAAGEHLTRADLDARSVEGLTLDETIGHMPRLMSRYTAAFAGQRASLLHYSTGGELLWTQWRPRARGGAVAVTVSLSAVSMMPSAVHTALERLRTGERHG